MSLLLAPGRCTALLEGGSAIKGHISQATTRRFLPAALAGETLECVPFPPADLDSLKRTERRYMGPQFMYGALSAQKVLSTLTSYEAKEVGLYVATRVAERDEVLDEELFKDALIQPGDAHVCAAFRERFRPNQFLAQLPNLLASNLSILYGLKGPSRTFIGEEMAGAHAVEAGIHGVAEGACTLALVGASINGDREGLARWYWAGRERHGTSLGANGPPRKERLGSAATFLVLSSKSTSAARPIQLSFLGNARCRSDGDIEEILREAIASHPSGRVGHLVTNASLARHTCLVDRVARDHEISVTCIADESGSLLEADCPTQIECARAMLDCDSRTSQAVIVLTISRLGAVALFSLEVSIE